MKSLTTDRIRRLFRLGLAVCAWGYAAAMVAVLLTIRIGGDDSWFPTILLYGPRAFYIAPLAVLAPWAWFSNRRYLFFLLIPALLWAGPIMGFCIPWARFAAPAEANPIRVMTCNVHACWADQDQLLRLIRYYKVDVAVYQESYPEDTKVPPGWHMEHRTSLTILSRWPIRDIRGRRSHVPYTPWPRVDCLAATINTDHGPIDVVTVHLRTPRWGLQQVLDRNTIVQPSRSNALTQEVYYRNLESQNARAWISKNCKAPTVVAGDFNLVPDGQIYRRNWGDLQNAYSVAGFGYGYTRWSELPLGIRYGARIDQILCDEGLTATSAMVAPTVGSDHLPVIATLEVLPRKQVTSSPCPDQPVSIRPSLPGTPVHPERDRRDAASAEAAAEVPACGSPREMRQVGGESQLVPSLW